MIPLKLTVEGIYSYQERQTIDFAELTSGGLFGILGGVGSGKSSILEAITYALYGRTNRLGNNDRRNYNMMNLKSNRMYVEFDFMNHDNEVYRATREIRRNSKNFNDVRSPIVQFYKLHNEDWTPMDHSNAEELIGLSYQNFTRTIIIPQGQFKEFLELGPTDRTTMLKEIFQLHRYDLQDRVGSLRNATTVELNTLEGRLMEYESVSEEDLNTKSENLDELVKQLDIIKKEHEGLDVKYQLWKGLKDDYTKLQDNKGTHANLLRQLPDIKARQEQLQTYERLFAKFDRLIADYKRSVSKANDLKRKHDDTHKIYDSFAEKLKLKRDELEKLMPLFNALPEKRKEESDLVLISQIIGYRAEIEKKKERQLKGADMVNNAEDILRRTTESIKTLELKVNQFSNQRYESKVLVELDGWYTQNEVCLKAIDKSEKDLSIKKKNLEELLKEIEDKKISIENYESQFNDAISKLAAREQKINSQKDDFLLKQQMTEYASALHDGGACPLCGSTEHPNIVSVEDVSQHLGVVASELKKISEERDALQAMRNTAVLLANQKQEIELQLSDLKNVLIADKESLVKHQSKFVWEGFRADDRSGFEEKKKESYAIEKQIANLNKELGNLRRVETKQRQDLEKYKKLLDEIKNEEEALLAKIEANRSNLKVVSFDAFSEYTHEYIVKHSLNLKNENDKIENDYNELNSKIVNLDKQTETNKAILDELNKQLSSAKGELELLKKDIATQLSAEGYDELSSVEDILATKLDVEKERNEIQQFQTRLSVVQDRIETLEAKLKAVSYDNTQFEKYEIEWIESKKRLDDQNNKVVGLRLEIQTLTDRLKEKQQLLVQHGGISKRADNLNLMFNLFRGQGFVQYVSSIYLAQLCEHANVRFRRMTRNQLMLQINENNEFEIVDYLNEGRTRSVKTLSGGQSFQVSLSLALALAESVQTNAKADKNFFFIDEGFGTQDLESVNIVFETLLNLNKENKIVGIISHVEELKERIPMTLTVEKDGERGSLIR